MDMEDTVAIKANYASPFNIGKIWTTLIDLSIKADSFFVPQDTLDGYSKVLMTDGQN